MNPRMWSVLLAAALTPLAAADEMKTPPNRTPKAEAATDARAKTLAAKYGVPESEVLSLRTKGYGWGEINNALAIAQKADQPVSEIVALRQSGMGWGKIAQKYGFTLGDVVGKGHGDRERERDRDREKDKERAERRDRDDARSHGGHEGRGGR